MTIIAEIVVFTILTAFLIIHLGILLKLIPYKLVWGSRLKSNKDMYRFEAISLLMVLFFLWVSAMQLQLVSSFLSERLLNIIFWVMTVFFFLNTLGNLTSKNKVEQLIFTPMALLLAVGSLLIALH